MTIEEMLEQRHTLRLVWYEPWPALGSAGAVAHVTCTATVDDCIGIARHMSSKMGRLAEISDADHMLDFMAVHWAEPVKEHGHERADLSGQVR